jgi:hypothetical protein
VEGVVCLAIPDELVRDELLLSVAHHVSVGSVKLCEPAFEKARTSTFNGALDFRASEKVDDPLRCALLLSIAMNLDPQSWRNIE